MKQGLLALIFLLVAGCSSAPYQEDGLAKVHTGMDKDAVLDVAGSPTRTYRENSQDHWVYEYIKDGEHFIRQVIFQSGLVLSVGSTHEKRPVSEDGPASEDGKDFKQFEKRLREETEKPKGEFKDIQ